MMIAAIENDEPCGFLLHGPPRTVIRVYQTCIQPDARLIDHGRDLIDQLTMHGRAHGSQAISLYCADDLTANNFWAALNFTRVGQRRKSTRRDRTQWHWMRAIGPHASPDDLRLLDPERPPRVERPVDPRYDALKQRLGRLLSLTPRRP